MTDARPNKMFIPLSSFDPELLPEGRRDPGSSDFGLAVHEHLTEELSALGLNARIVVGPDQIEIEWSAGQETDVLSACVRLLNEGKHRQAVPLLRGLLEEAPESPAVLFNLGMALSDLGEFDESIQHLRSLIALRPDHSDGLSALGVALARAGQVDDAVDALAKACEADTKNPHAHRNLAAALMKRGDFSAAVPHLKQAADLHPQDPAAWFGLGQASLQAEDPTTADAAFRKVFEVAPGTDIADAAKTELRKLAEGTFRKRGVSGSRPDALEYCISALKAFTPLTDEQLKPILFELATKGEQGFDINNPEKRYRFESLEGDFTGLKAVCYMYVAAQRILPGQDIGIDLSSEFEQAKSTLSG